MDEVPNEDMQGSPAARLPSQRWDLDSPLANLSRACMSCLQIEIRGQCRDAATACGASAANLIREAGQESRVREAA